MSEFYCFISYKHQKDAQFKADQSWAKALEAAFHRLKIKMPPVKENDVIQAYENSEKARYVDSICRDFTHLSGGDFQEGIHEALGNSRKLVSIVSKEMLENQNNIVKESREAGTDDIYKEAWCYNEICDFLTFDQHTLDDVIIVYIGEDDFSENIIPEPLRDINVISKIKHVFSNNKEDETFKKMTSDEKKAYLENYWKRRNIILAYKDGKKKDLYDIVASKIACNIFGVEGDGANVFISYRKQEKRKQIRTFIAFSLAVLILVVVVFFLWQRSNVFSAFGDLESAKNAFANYDIPKAISLSLKAEKFGGSFPEIKEFQWKAFENDYTKPFQVIKNKTITNSPDNGVWEINDKSAVLINQGKDEAIVFPMDPMILNIVFSPNGKRVAFQGYDSLYVYNRENGIYEYSTPINGRNGEQICFSPDNMNLLCHWGDTVFVHSLVQKKKTIIHGQYDRVVANESELLAVSRTNDSLFVSSFLNHDLSFSKVESWPLLANYTNVECNPKTHTVITISKDTIAFYSPNYCRILAHSVGWEPLYAFDKHSDKFVLFTNLNESNGNRRGGIITLWDKGIYTLNTYSFSDVKCITFGQNNDIVLYSGGKIYVWRYTDNKIFTLDASDCQLSEQRFGSRLICDGNNIFLAEDIPGVEDDFYASFHYPDFSILHSTYPDLSRNTMTSWSLCDSTMVEIQNNHNNDSLIIRVHNPFDEKISVWKMKSTNYAVQHGNNWIFDGNTFYKALNGDIITTIPTEEYWHHEVLESEQRIVLFGTHSYKVFSLESGALINESQYSFSENIDNHTIETNYFGNGFLYAVLKHFYPSDTGSSKGCSWLISIDLKTGQQSRCISHDGFVFLSNDSHNILLSSQFGDIQLLDSCLNVLSALNIGEFAGKPQLAINGKYYASSESGNLYCCSFHNSNFKRVSLPYRAESLNGKLFNGRYYLIYTDDSDSKAKFLFDLISNRIALYLLPEETIEEINGNEVIVHYQSNISNQVLRYTRPLLTDKELSIALKTML